MKKIIAMLLALVMICGLATVAFAAADSQVIENADATTSFKFVKEYKTTAGATPATFPTETLKFEVTQSAVTGAPIVTMEDHSVETNPDDIVLTVGPATVPGQFEYTIKEVEGDTQGVTYDTTTELKVTVLVYWDEVTTTDPETNESTTTRVLKKQVTVTKPATGSKVDTIANKYDLGDLSVTKTVSGNLANKEVPFTIDVVFTTETGLKVYSDITYTAGTTSEAGTITGDGWTGSKTVTIAIKDGATVDFTNIPKGVTYTVIEKDQHKLAAGATVDPNSAADKDYTATGEVTTAKGIVVDTKTAETINNHKETSVATGIALDSMPYVLILAVAMGGLVLFTTKKRVQE